MNTYHNNLQEIPLPKIAKEINNRDERSIVLCMASIFLLIGVIYLFNNSAIAFSGAKDSIETLGETLKECQTDNAKVDKLVDDIKKRLP